MKCDVFGEEDEKNKQLRTKRKRYRDEYKEKSQLALITVSDHAGCLTSHGDCRSG